MRTVSFSDHEVQTLLNTQFVNTFNNTTGDPTSGMSISHRPNDRPGPCLRGNGKQNVQTIFLTPSGSIFHAATGFLSPEDLLVEAKFANQLFRKLEESDANKAPSLIASEHRKRLIEKGFTDDEIDDQSPMASMKMLAQQFGPPSFKRPGFGKRTANGSNNRNGFQNPMAQFSRIQFLEDNKFSIQNPKLTFNEFDRDPTGLVGSGKSFFASSSSN